MKAVFGGAVKKPLMTKVSMRHLNEIVRERNQYSRDALEAWQDFINLKGRMDTELSKVTKRNNFLVEELESWKQQVCPVRSFMRIRTKVSSSSNSKPLPNNSQRRPRILRLKLRTTNAKIAASLRSSTNKRMMLPVSLFAFRVLRNSVMMLLKLLFCNKKLLKNSNGSGSATRKSSLHCSTLTSLSSDNVMRLNVLFCTFEV